MSDQRLKTFTKKFVDQDDAEVEVSTTQFLGFRGVKLQTKLFRLILPIFSGVKSFKGSLKDVDLDTEVVVKHILENATESKISELIKELVACTIVDNKDLSTVSNFDMLVAGNYELLVNILRFIIDSNNFFGKGGIGTMLSRLEKLPMLPK